jgi:AraC-like DNA-binding protein
MSFIVSTAWHSGDLPDYLGPTGDFVFFICAFSSRSFWLFSFPTRRRQMVGGTATFTDPGDYQASVAGASINLVLTGGGNFDGRLTWINLRRLRLVRGRETVPHIAFVEVAPETVLIAFPTSRDPSQIWGGVKLRSADIVLLGPRERIHRRTSKASSWSFISLARKDLAAHAGMDLISPKATKILRPAPAAVAHLSRLHAQACLLAETKSELVTQQEVVRTIEHGVLNSLVNCLTAADAHGHAAARRRHISIMARFEATLATHDNRNLSARELCAAIGVSERTLRLCCVEVVGMSPGSYARLRRLNLVRAALRRADPTITRVSELARRYGFSELGRFAVTYRTVFGEMPSTTLRCNINKL